MKSKTKVSKEPLKAPKRKVNDETMWGWATQMNVACDEFFRRRGLTPEPTLFIGGVPQVDYGLEDNQE